MSSKRQNETETSDVGDAKTVITFQQETSSNSAASKKKRKLENDNGIGDDTKKTRNLDKENVSINYIQQKDHILYFLSNLMLRKEFLLVFNLSNVNLMNCSLSKMKGYYNDIFFLSFLLS